MKFIGRLSTLIGAGLLIVGCSGGSGDTSFNSSDIAQDSPQSSQKLHGYYVDDPIANVDYICGKYSGKTDLDGKFYFEAGERCKFLISEVTLREISQDKLKDGIYIVENDPKVAEFIQSLDSSGDSEDKIFIDERVKEKLELLNLTEIPSESELKNLIDELNSKLKDEGLILSFKTKQDAIARVQENLDNKYKDKEHILTFSSQKGSGESGSKPTKNNPTAQETQATPLTPESVDESVNQTFGVDNTQEKIDSENMKALVGNWAGEANYIKIELQLRKDGTYKYHSRLGIGKYHNYYRYSDYEGTWHLEKGNSQIVLDLPNVDAPLILTNKFPKIETPAGVELSAGSGVDSSFEMDIDQSQNIVTANYTDKAKEYMNQKVADFRVDYFTMVAPKANSEEFWSSVGIRPAGYNYGHKLGLGSDDWNYAIERIKSDPEDYTMVISDENWQTLIGHRKQYINDIQNPQKVYKWLEYFKGQMQILGKVEGTVLYIIAGDAPPYWAGDVRQNHNNDPKTISGKIIESRFPEVLERNPSNSWAGIFQMMDYLRMKYAPNVKIGYTLKTWGIAEKDIYHEPESGWDGEDSVKVMAEYLNNYGVQFDFLSFNFHPRSSHTTDEYESAAKYFGAISKQIETRDGNIPKLWIWKISLWNTEQPKFYFTHIDFLVDECNAIGMTLGHGNDLAGKSGFSDEPDKEIYVKSWMEEYYKGIKIDSIPTHATQGLINWR